MEKGEVRLAGGYEEQSNHEMCGKNVWIGILSTC